MNDHIDPDKVRELIEKWRGTTNQTIHRVNLVYEVAADDLEALLPTPKPKTLADLIEEGHDTAQYQWMQAERRDERCIISRINNHASQTDVSLLTATGSTIWVSPDEVIPLPDLPRLVWPASEPEQDDETPTPESAPEPRFTPGGFMHSSLDNVNAHEPQAGEASVVEGLPEELQALLNRYSAESVSGTPDFILGDFLIGVIKEYNEAVSRRAEWRGEPIDLPALAHIKPEVAPKVLTTEEDYREAPDGTICAGGMGLPFHTSTRAWCSPDGIRRDHRDLAGTPRRVLRWGMGGQA